MFIFIKVIKICIKKVLIKQKYFEFLQIRKLTFTTSIFILRYGGS